MKKNSESKLSNQFKDVFTEQKLWLSTFDKSLIKTMTFAVELFFLDGGSIQHSRF